jgi:protein-disulfide isomerase
MARLLTFVNMILVLLALSAPAMAQGVPVRSVGQERAPIVIDEYVSLTCPHCADFFLNTLPELEKRYVKTGKVRIVFNDFPLDGTSLKAAALARCMPAESFFPFIRILYENQQKWAAAGNPEKTLIQYARLGGLDEDRAKFCLNDPGMQSAIMAERTTAESQFSVQSTPTFVFNKGAEKMEGASHIEGFATILDRMLARRK